MALGVSPLMEAVRAQGVPLETATIYRVNRISGETEYNRLRFELEQSFRRSAADAAAARRREAMAREEGYE